MYNISEDEIMYAIQSGRLSELGTLYEIMGIDALKQFLYTYQGCSINIPLIKSIQKESQPERIYADYLQGMDYRQLARKYKLAMKTVYGIVGKVRREKIKTKSG